MFEIRDIPKEQHLNSLRLYGVGVHWCSVGELNTSKAKLRGANYPREKSNTRWFS